MDASIESVVLNEWHILCAVSELGYGDVRRITLFDQEITVTRMLDDSISVRQSCVTQNLPGSDVEDAVQLPVRQHCGYVWSSLGTPPHEPFPVPEFFEEDRRLIHCGSFGVHVSAPRAVENFLDLAHFPFVHQGVLGIEPHTDVKDYEVAVSSDSRELIAKGCRFYQPLSSFIRQDRV